jgi:hypothetical protein
MLIFAVLGGPAAWTFHLFFAYFLVSWHLGLDGFGIRAVILIVTAILAGVAILAAIASVTAWRHTADRDRSLDEPTSRSGFLARIGLVLSLLFCLAIVAEAVPVFMERL